MSEFDEDFTMEWFDVKGWISDVRITKGCARYPIRRRWGTWLYHRWPWLPSWITGWVTLRFTKPVAPFPSSPTIITNTKEDNERI